MHIAETKEQAIADVASGWRSGSTTSARSPTCRSRPTPPTRSLVDALNASGMAVVGTPDEAVAKIEALIEQSGGFGAFLFMAHNWAAPRPPGTPTSSSPATWRRGSRELLAP